jgi:hypothetical protein
MITKETADALTRSIFRGESENVYAVLDGASVEDLLPKLYELQPEFECLYRGDLEPDLAEVAPYLVQLEPGGQFTEWVFGDGWGEHWGVFAASEADLRAMRSHLRTLLTVHDPDGKPLLFRYYDPRVLRLYLPTCNAEELRAVFGPVSRYVLEGEDPQTVLQFEFDGGALRRGESKLESPEA